jgi:hypothetical protein
MRHELQQLKLQDFIDMGYRAEEVDTEIFLIHDFLTKEESDQIIKMAEDATEEEWSTYYMDGLRSFAKVKFGTDDIDTLVEQGKLEITHRWKDKNLMMTDMDLMQGLNKRLEALTEHIENLAFNGTGTIQRQYEGAELTVHVDNHTDPSLVYAAIIYVNDDYTDGELIFPTRDFEIKPPAGALVIFPTHEEYLHGVKPPGAGPLRYVLPCFIGEQGFYDRNKF